jgi:hypothetical protein
MKTLPALFLGLAGLCLLGGACCVLLSILVEEPSPEANQLALTRGIPLLVAGGVLASVGVRLRPRPSPDGSPSPSPPVLVPLLVGAYLIGISTWVCRRAWDHFVSHQPFPLFESALWLLAGLGVLVLLVRRLRASS